MAHFQGNREQVTRGEANNKDTDSDIHLIIYINYIHNENKIKVYSENQNGLY